LPPSTRQLDQDICQLQNSAGVETVKVGEWTEDNTILVSKSPEKTIGWKLDLIKAANYSIEISGTYAGGKVFRDALEAIEARIKEKAALQVHILIVPDLLESKDKKLLKRLSKDYPSNFHCLQSKFQFNRKGYRIENYTKVVLVYEK